MQIAAINVAGQLALNSHTIVFNNANVTSAGVIDARTRDGMVNRTYGSVVPGTVNFMGANGNNFLNTANNASMSIANSANIVSALNGGHMSENGAGRGNGDECGEKVETEHEDGTPFIRCGLFSEDQLCLGQSLFCFCRPWSNDQCSYERRHDCQRGDGHHHQSRYLYYRSDHQQRNFAILAVDHPK